MAETASGDGPPAMDVSTAAEARSRPYYGATSGAELDWQRALPARLSGGNLRGSSGGGRTQEVPANEVLGKSGETSSSA